VTLTPIKDDKQEIIGYKTPAWDITRSQKYKEDGTLLS